ncbi:putative TetR-family transcriptional regulator [Actinoplanes missouriensis 431]|uniref:Putative TetR-family transcriptional regulator n=1 Tax=Actinoplanes missouriensis (strain ATCC 14538 / DSM 43046 / CBS 188.64 / JCM 3121 / NBRC 102363 / NCIMB 12654 / NRRL B-3342 / UNCC 431) TaxID=512565 RepID=I0HE43_ACTM4|nr:TetR/AcrR family transcriptional regulator [Actinoplanes missouriensis]BAL91280.1 putative TetR-family transcriptional regulator [Actinoplanes missouriensis 431]
MSVTAASGEPAPTVRKRPKDRKAQLALAAAELFCERGYHGVSLDEIATAVGISGPAIYRHFPNKYAMLVFATRKLTDTVLDATTSTDLDELLMALARLAVAGRKVAGLYQWEWRYLDADHREEFRGDLEVLVRRLAVPLMDLRPSLTGPDAEALVRAALSVFGSVGTHRAAIAKGRGEAALHRAAWAVLRGEPPTPEAVPSGPSEEQAVRVGARREILLAESVQLFHRYGYHAVGVEEIGRAAGINASSVYRYFPGKADILAAAFYRASERVAETTAVALAGADGDEDALRRMSQSYVDLTFERSALVSVYLAENNNLPEADRHELRKVQRLHVEEWVRLLGRLRPELAAAEARLLVHAALNVVTDLSRWVRFDRSSGMDRHLVRLALTVLKA